MIGWGLIDKRKEKSKMIVENSIFGWGLKDAKKEKRKKEWNRWNSKGIRKVD